MRITSTAVGLLCLVLLSGAAVQAKPHHKHHGHHDDRREERREERREMKRHKRHRAPAWAGGYWRPNEKRYMAVVPGDPSRVYVLRGGKWLLRPVKEAQFRADIDPILGLPLPPLPPPVPLPNIGVDLKVMLFD